MDGRGAKEQPLFGTCRRPSSLTYRGGNKTQRRRHNRPDQTQPTTPPGPTLAAAAAAEWNSQTNSQGRESCATSDLDNQSAENGADDSDSARLLSLGRLAPAALRRKRPGDLGNKADCSRFLRRFKTVGRRVTVGGQLRPSQVIGPRAPRQSSGPPAIPSSAGAVTVASVDDATKGAGGHGDQSADQCAN
uniref:Uncharacterized protein n=1 Tax=Plectus sambesii TaxID=2011161 RepID=A0A914VPC7_9BILA